jgi:hypothetical protein
MDETELIRRQMVASEQPTNRKELEALHGKVWTTAELAEDFSVLGFAAPFVVVERKSDGRKGSLQFQHSPRFYFCFVED